MPIKKKKNRKIEETGFNRSNKFNLKNKNTKKNIIAVIITIILVNLMFPHYNISTRTDVPREGEITKRSYIAPFTFDILKTDEELKKERHEAISNVLSVVEYDYDATEKIFKSAENLMHDIQYLRKRSANDSLRKIIWKDLKTRLSIGAIKTLVSSRVNIRDILHLIDNLLEKGITSTLFIKNIEELEKIKDRFQLDYIDYHVTHNDFISFLRDGEVKTINISQLLIKDMLLETQKDIIKKHFGKNLYNTIYEVLYAYIAPNTFYNDQVTRERKEIASRSVLATKGKVIKDLMIIGKNQLVTKEIHDILLSLKIAQNSREKKMGLFNNLFPIIGEILFVIIIIGFFVSYVSIYRPHITERWSYVLALCIIFTLQFLLFFSTKTMIDSLILPLEWDKAIRPEYLLPIVFGPMIISILFDMELGIIFALTFSMLSGIALGFDFKLALTFLTAGTIASASLRNIRYRSHFFAGLAFILFTYLILIGINLLLSRNLFSVFSFFNNFMLAAVSSIIALMLTMTLLWVFEKLFHLTSNLTLMELADMNTPILKRMAVEAPGTYHHSILIGTLAEAAAEKVGSNSLKVRVLAFYHDIGKIPKSEYFIENSNRSAFRSRDGKEIDQEDGEAARGGDDVIINLHDTLSPSMSTKIILSHVRQGVELAKQYKLPSIIKDVIKEHHGTTQVSFFYQNAVKLAIKEGQDPDKVVLKDDFCYPGPKPRTTETAIIMLADSVEAATRSLSSPSITRIENMVNNVVETRIKDGQLNDCGLTLNDIARIKESFIPILMSMFHKRIEYPDTETETKKVNKKS